MKTIILIITICASVYMSFAQNFGIDKSSPAEKLDVNGNIQANSAFLGVGGHGGTYMHLSHSNYKGVGEYALLQHGTAGHTYLNSAGTGNIHFRNNNTNLMTLLSSGEFGIGTLTPGAKLHVFSPDAEIAEVYATGSSQGSGMFFAGQNTAYGGGFVYDGDGTPALVGGSDRITFFNRNNNTDGEVMSYAYSSDILRINSLAGTGTRMVTVNASGDLSTGTLPEVAYAQDRTQNTYTNANNGFVTASLNTNNLAVTTGDVVVVSYTAKFAFTGGSGGDDVGFRIRITGSCGTLYLSDTYQYENFDNDRNEYQPIAGQYVWSATCTGNVAFNLEMDHNSDADDAAKTGDCVIIAAKY